MYIYIYIYTYIYLGYIFHRGYPINRLPTILTLYLMRKDHIVIRISLYSHSYHKNNILSVLKLIHMMTL